MGIRFLIKRIQQRFYHPPRVKQTEAVLISLPPLSGETPPIGVAYLKAYLQKAGISTTCIDLNIHLGRNNIISRAFGTKEDFELHWKMIEADIRRILRRYRDARIVGFSVMSNKSIWVLEKIEGWFSGIKVAGGPACKDSRTVSHMVDHVVTGRGEKTIVEIAGGKPTDELLYPDFTDFDLSRYKSHDLYGLFSLPISSGIGCSRKCTFCTTSFYWPDYHPRTGLEIYKEMVYQNDLLGVNAFVFSDAAMNGSSKTIRDLCNLLIKNKKLFCWKGYFSLDDRTDSEMVRLMAAAGCTRVNIGLESGSEKVRDHMGKGVPDTRVTRILKQLKNCGMHVHLLLMVGYPTETDKDFELTMRFLNRHQKYIDSVNIGTTCHIFPKSHLGKNAKRLGIELKKDIYGWTFEDNTPKIRAKRHQLLSEYISRLDLYEVKESKYVE